MTTTSPNDTDDRCAAAVDAGQTWNATTRAFRAQVLRALAAALDSRREDLVAVAARETHLPVQRLNGELTRTTYQLELFAEVLDEGSYLEVILDSPGQTPAGPRPDLRRHLIPVGPVAVFAASNFPFAFSVAGGDTASALAAGCPVIVKVHPGHLGTSVLTHEVLVGALVGCGAAAATVQLVGGFEAGLALVRNAAVKAVAFTGSLAGGRALSAAIAARPDPIPFFGELGSVNPVFVLPSALTTDPSGVGTALAESGVLGNGQFCTKPQFVFAPEGTAGDLLLEAMAAVYRGCPEREFLTPGIAASFDEGTTRLSHDPRLEVVVGGPGPASPLLLGGAAEDFAAIGSEEVFGPAQVVLRYADPASLIGVVDELSGSLTATVWTDPATDSPDREFCRALVTALTRVCGRLLFNAVPTGVAVGWAQHHGGPWPSTNSQHTSVGATSIRRFLRPLVYQSAPAWLLPDELRGVKVPTRVDGRLVLPSGA